MRPFGVGSSTVCERACAGKLSVIPATGGRVAMERRLVFILVVGCTLWTIVLWIVVFVVEPASAGGAAKRMLIGTRVCQRSPTLGAIGRRTMNAEGVLAGEDFRG